MDGRLFYVSRCYKSMRLIVLQHILSLSQIYLQRCRDIDRLQKIRLFDPIMA